MELGWKYLTSSDKDAILRGIADGVAYGGPFHAEIHPADRCNIDCFFCSTASIRGTDELPMLRFEQLLGELRDAGTRSIRLSGGGEPLFHRQIRTFLGAVRDSGIPIENVTTNAVLLDEAAASLLIDCKCDQITVSLNTGDAKTYSSMMQTPERIFDRVIGNMRALIAERRARGLRHPAVNLQFLVWKENFRSIPEMYALARDIGVDSIQFNGLAFLQPEQKMTPAETDEMMALYEEIVRVDELRCITAIESFEQDISPRVRELATRLSAERNARGVLSRLSTFLLRSDYTLKEKLAHRRKLRESAELETRLSALDEYCIIGWHSLVVRTNGNVGPCCILQGSPIGNIYTQSLRDVWHGDGFQRLRRELSAIMNAGDDWQHDPERDSVVVPMCGARGAEICPIRSFYFRMDLPFMERFNGQLPHAADATRRAAP
ncbi:MAG: radical SAM/SPASM domain-containing protein [Thermoanaerobaculia bacterium]